MKSFFYLQAWEEAGYFQPPQIAGASLFGLTISPVNARDRLALVGLGAIEVSEAELVERLAGRVQAAVDAVEGDRRAILAEFERLGTLIDEVGRPAAEAGDARTLEGVRREVEEALSIRPRFGRAIREAEVIRDALDGNAGCLLWNAGPVQDALTALDAVLAKIATAAEAIKAHVREVDGLIMQARDPATTARIRAAGQEIRLRNTVTPGFIADLRTAHAKALEALADLAGKIKILEGVA